MGYKIVQSFYDNAGDKRRALRDILNIQDFRDFLQRSRYREKFAR
jgi:hypothetical protein